MKVKTTLTVITSLFLFFFNTLGINAKCNSTNDIVKSASTNYYSIDPDTIGQTFTSTYSSTIESVSFWPDRALGANIVDESVIDEHLDTNHRYDSDVGETELSNSNNKSTFVFRGTHTGDSFLMNTDAFITKWETTTADESITIPTTGGGYDYIVDWGDGTIESSTTGNPTHIYTTPGEHEIIISGSFPRIYFNSSGDKSKITEVMSWGTNSWRNMENAFQGCNNIKITATDAPDLSSVTSMREMFRGATSITDGLSNWDVSTIEDMSFMFRGCTNFNSNISSWNVSNVENFASFLFRAEAFNQDLSAWDVSKVYEMRSMFSGAFSFNQDLSAWNISNVTSANQIFNNSNLSTENYDAILKGWATLDTNAGETAIPNGILFGAVNVQYCEAEFKHYQLINTNGWTITDGGKTTDCNNSFITEWQTTTANESITIPTTGTGYDYLIDWGDGTVEGSFTGDATHTYATAGTYTVSITGNFPRIYFNFEVEGDRNKIQQISQWGPNPWTTMENAFSGCENLEVTATDAPNLANVTSTKNMFASCINLIGNTSFNTWDVSTIEDMSNMFSSTNNFNQDLDTWDVSNVTLMSDMFASAFVFNGNIGTWNTEEVTDMDGMFFRCEAFTGVGGLNSWDVSKVEYMNNMFRRASIFNQDLDNWNVTNVREMNNMFWDATRFNGNISTWNVSNLEEMRQMFYDAKDFNSDISQWNISTNITSLSNVFRGAESFNRNINSWDVSNVTNMIELFYGAVSFNQPLDNWDTSSVGEAYRMFYNATSFNQSLGSWDLSGFDGVFNFNMGEMLANSGISTENYDATLIGWASLDIGETAVPSNVQFGAGSTQYCNAELQRFELINTFSWNFTDGGKATDCNNSFISIWETTTANESITIPIIGDEGFRYIVDWGDGTTEGPLEDSATHTYTTAGTYTVSIIGTFPRIYFNFEGDRNKIKEITQWGPNPWSTMENAFAGCENLEVTATDAPNLSYVTSTSGMFAGCTNIAGNSVFNTWDVATIDNMSNMFADCTIFNTDLNNWNVANVTTMNSMFTNATTFNGNISTWNTPQLKDMSKMFDNAEDFTGVGGLNNWDVSNVEFMSNTFRRADNFNQDLDTWNVSNVTMMDGAFSGTLFNGNISTWNVSSVTNMDAMFYLAEGFNQDIGNWDVSSLEAANYMFFEAPLFNQNIGNWDISSLNSAAEMFSDAGLSTENYDATLIGWTTLDAGETQIPTNLTFDGGNSQFCESVLERFELISTYNWTITDSGRTTDCINSDSFITVWETTTANESITMPIFGDEGSNFIIHWGDGTTEGPFTDDPTHTYTTAGTYTVSIIGYFPRIFFINEGDKAKIKEVSQWGTIQWSTMENAFAGCENLVVTATDAPDLSYVTSTSAMFANCTNLTGNTAFNTWDVSTIEDMNHMFAGCFIFDTDISNWNVSNVTDMNNMFVSALDFNQDISSWNVGSVTNMQDVFFTALSFDQDLSSWNVSNVTNMSGMFRNSSFNNDISSWDVSNVEDMENMFRNTPFNQDVGAWDISSVTNMTGMFNGVTLSTTNYDNTLIGWATLDTDAGETQIPTGISFGGGNSQYCESEFERFELMDAYTWTITDGEQAADCINNVNDSDYFITVWETTTDNESITIPTTGAGYSYRVDWGDGTEGLFTADATHTYTTAGTHTVSIIGNFPRIFFNNEGDNAAKILEVSQWGINPWENMELAFASCVNLDVTATDAPNLSNVTSTISMFSNCPSLLGNTINTWNVSTIENMTQMFAGCNTFNTDLDNWNVSNVTTMYAMFIQAHAFNGDISTWNVSSVTNMAGMFFNAHAFNQDIGNWDVSDLEIANFMFAEAEAFNQDLGDWDISSMTAAVQMFRNVDPLIENLSTENYDATLIGWATLDTDAGETQIPTGISFGGGNSQYCASDLKRFELIDTYGWNITDDGKVTDCINSDSFITVWETTTTNESITIPTHPDPEYNYIVNWGDGTEGLFTADATHTYATTGTYTVSIIGNFPRIFFNNEGDKNKIQKVSQWGINPWASMDYAFYGCANLDVTATDAPNLSNVTSTYGMFAGCSSLLGNQYFNTWDVSTIEDMTIMFASCTVFNTDLDNWNVSKVENMAGMFRVTEAFNGDITTWNVSSVTIMAGMFVNAEAFNQDIGNWDVSNLENTNFMFINALAFNQDLGAWDISSLANASAMFNGVTLSTANYDNTLIGWATLDTDAGETQIPTNLTFDGGNSQYCASDLKRFELIDTYGWNIIDAGKVIDCINSDSFITVWETTTTNESITIPTHPDPEYNYIVNWGDGTEGLFTADATHTYADAGTYSVSIIGNFPRITFNNVGDAAKILEVSQWGSNPWTSMDGAFAGCVNLDVTATDTPNLSNATSTNTMFFDCTSLVGNEHFNTWNVSTIEDMSFMFFNADIFNQDISSWNVSNATSLYGMFYWADTFNQDIGNWDISKVEYIDFMFFEAPAFDQNLGNWDISSLGILPGTGAEYMFTGAGLSTENYDATLLGWATLDAGETQIPMDIIFDGGNSQYCESELERFQLIGTYGWTITDGGIATDCINTNNNFITLWETTSANESITIPTTGSGYHYVVDWGDGNIEGGFTGDATHIYATAGEYEVRILGNFPRIFFNNEGDKDKIQKVSQWGTNPWASMDYAFYGCANLDVTATDAPDLSNATSTISMFHSCSSLEGSEYFNDWNVSTIENMRFMFSVCTDFNTDLDNWNVSSVTDMSGMFFDAYAFNQDIGNWDVSNVESINFMFINALAFNQDLGAWDISSVVNALSMFNGATLSTANYDNTLIGWATLDTDAGETQIPTPINFDGGNSQYCASDLKRFELIDTYDWNITDNGKVTDCINSDSFITVWETTTTNESITIPTDTNTEYNYIVNWGDGTEGLFTADATHTYAAAGTYSVSIIGNFPRIFFNFAGDGDKIQEVTQWGPNPWTSMEYAFAGCNNLNITATDTPNLANVTSTNSMFYNCSNLTGNTVFNTWDVATIENMGQMFTGCINFNTDLNNWNVANVTNMTAMFSNVNFFNGDISTWNTAQVTNMNAMFNRATNFNGNISTWNTAQVKNMDSMFHEAYVFNGDLSAWNVANVETMYSMFYGATAFNGNISTWNVANVIHMDYMFYLAQNFNQNIGNWDVSNVEVMDGMFSEAQNFDQDLGTWDISSLISAKDMFHNIGLSVENYDNLFLGWATLDAGETQIPTNVIFDGGNSTYCVSETKRQELIDLGWTITDGGINANCSDRFITTWETTTANETITIPTFVGATYNYTVVWGDGTIDTGVTANTTHTYATAGTYTVSIAGNFPRIYFNSGGDASKIQTIQQWGTTAWTSMENAFAGCENLEITAIDTPDLSNVADMTSMFEGAALLNNSLNNWDVSNVNTMDRMFYGATSFDQNLSDWDISAITSMEDMFTNAMLATANYDNTLIGWATLETGETQIPTGVTFSGGDSMYCASDYERQTLISSYNWTITDAGQTSDCNNRRFITTWKTGTTNERVTIPTTGSGYNYLVDWGDGNVDIGITGNAIHNYATAGTYTVSITGNFPRIYFNTSFNSQIQTINQWGGNRWDSMFRAFSTCGNLDVVATDVPNLSNVGHMGRMFFGCSSLIGNEYFNDWNVSNVNNFGDTFKGASSFNQPLNNWDVSNAIKFTGMFSGATSFDQSLADWDISSVLDSGVANAVGMFTGVTLSTENYDATLIGWATLDVGETRIPTPVRFDGGNSTYCLSETKRQELIDLGWTITDGGINADCGDVMLAAKVYLQGAALNPNVGEENLMRDDLRIAGLIPTRSPYADMISCDATVFNTTGNDAIVDWVWVEIRDENNNATVVSSQSALLQRDGDIVSTDGASALSFEVSSGNYYISVQHRNHLGIMSANTMALNATATTVDFTNTATPTFGSNAQTSFGVPTGTVAMWTGNVNSDSIIQYSGTNPDTPDILSEALNDPGNFLNFPTFAVGGYRNYDINMDGITQYSGTNPDTPFILQNVLAHPGNFLNFSTYQIQEQLPQN